jgi:hypothetical protein
MAHQNGLQDELTPTVGFSVEHVDWQRSKLTVIDMSGQERYHRLREHFFHDAQVSDALAILFIEQLDQADGYFGFMPSGASAILDSASLLSMMQLRWKVAAVRSPAHWTLISCPACGAVLLLQAVIFVVDAALAEEMPRCRGMLHQALSHADLAKLPLLVLCNKMDLSEALQPAEVAAALELTALGDRAIHIAGCSALQNTGMQVGGRGQYWLCGWLAAAAHRRICKPESAESCTSSHGWAAPAVRLPVAAGRKRQAAAVLDPAGSGWLLLLLQEGVAWLIEKLEWGG